ncbi:NAD(P)H-dependent oxidoreductase [Candidatus Sumerlaeota bacterium]|nr:NAD(P)H-dependent oxidoreductase [Candidatus Sumerlaeota bacterium]
MKTLILYYSRTGITRKVAETIQEKMKCDLEEIIDLKNRKGPLGFIVSGKDSVMKKLTEIKQIQKNPSDYDLVILGTPVWASTMSCAMRTCLRQYRDKFRNIAFFCTTGGTGITNTFNHMEQECGKKPLATMGLKASLVKKGRFMEEVSQFIRKISGS